MKGCFNQFTHGLHGVLTRQPFAELSELNLYFGKVFPGKISDKMGGALINVFSIMINKYPLLYQKEHRVLGSFNISRI